MIDNILVKLREFESSEWFGFTLVLALSLIGLFVARKMLLRKFNAFNGTTSARVVRDILAHLGFPIFFLIVFSSVLIGLQFSPEEVRNHPLVINGSKLIWIGMGFWILDRAFASMFKSQAIANRFTASSRILLQTIWKILILTFGLLMALNSMGISITPILASLGVGSVAVALALQDTLGNFFSGFYLLVDKPIRIGDFIKLDEGIEGHVVKIGWRSTQIKMLANNIVVLPNTKVAAAQITNYDLMETETAVLVQMGVAYDSDLEKVERVTTQVASEVLNRVEGGVSSFKPFIRYHTFADSSINFTVILRAKHITDQHLLKHEFTKALHAKYLREGISIPFPQRVLHVHADNLRVPNITERR